jgi:DNA-binding transcriptional regulator PaaX
MRIIIIVCKETDAELEATLVRAVLEHGGAELSESVVKPNDIYISARMNLEHAAHSRDKVVMRMDLSMKA